VDAKNSTLLHLSLIEGVGPAAIKNLLDTLSDIQEVYTFSSHEVKDRCCISTALAEKIVQGLQDRSLLARELDLLQKSAIQIITIADEQYPALLREIHLPPLVLYVQGDAELLSRDSLAIVGSRAADGYAQRVIDFLVPDFVAAGLTITSGGAIGADSFAHEATLACGGTTIAVLGSGLLQLYPSKNKKLFARMVEQNGLLVSSFPLQTLPMPGHFPARNRIIAGLSLGCLVVQADISSGAKITAQFALEQGRDVFAIPGTIDHPLSAGCHALIGQGATLVTTSADVLEQYGITFHVENIQPSDTSPKLSYQISAKKFEDSQQQQIYDLCRQPQTLDMLLEATKLEMSSIQKTIFELQIQGVLEQDLAGRWYAQ
jgi:DNA processing protein